MGSALPSAQKTRCVNRVYLRQGFTIAQGMRKAGACDRRQMWDGGEQLSRRIAASRLQTENGGPKDPPLNVLALDLSIRPREH